MTRELLLTLITFFILALFWELFHKNWPMVLYYAGATLLNIGVLIK